jgi:putative superfamily III holin-X
MSVRVEPQFEPSRAPTSDDASIGQLTSQLTEQLSRLVRDELALAQLEAKQRAKRFGLGLGMFGVGGIFLFFGACAAIAAAILALAIVVPGWLAALIVAGALMVLAGIVALTGKKSFDRGSPPMPTEAIRSVREDAAVVKGALHR